MRTLLSSCSRILPLKEKKRMSMSQKQTEWVIDGAMLDTGFNILSTVGLPFLPTAKIANIRDISALMRENQKGLEGIGSAITTFEKLKFFSALGEKNVQLILIFCSGLQLLLFGTNIWTTWV